MNYRIFILLWILLCLPSMAFAVRVDVTVKGVDTTLQANILARLGLAIHSDNPRLSVYDIKRLHKQAEEEIRDAVAPYGYYSPQIHSSLSGSGEEYAAVYTIDVGIPIRVRELRISTENLDDGEGIFTGLSERFPLQPGEILNQGKYEDGKKQIIRLALSQGYMNARYRISNLRIDRPRKEADIVLTLDSGPRFVFGETIFEQEYITDELLQRYIPYKAGDPYLPAKVIELQKVLYRTDYFNRVVVQGEVNRADGLAVPVVVKLTPPDHLNRYSVGLGYATDTGARARLGWRNRLLNPKGHAVRVTGQVGETDNELSLNYEIPYRNPSNDKIALRTSYQDLLWEDTETRLFTLGAGLEHRGKHFSHGGSIEYRDERYSIGATEGQSRLTMPSFSSTFIWADSLLNTKYGVEFSFAASGAAEGMGSDTSFAKGVVGGKLILSLMPGWRIISRASIGATVVDSIDSLPPSIRFYTGGDQSVRGYGYKELGTTDSSGAVVGGRYLLVGSAEIERELNETWSLAAFWDVGNAVDDLSLELKQGVGVGARYRVPFGQVRLDVASAISEDGAPMRLHLTVGADL